MYMKKNVGLVRAILAVGFVSPATAQVTVPPQTPPMSTEKLTPACAAAKAYVDLINAHRLGEVGSLFADKVDYIGPDAVHRSTRADVTKVYADVGEPQRMIRRRCA